MPPNIPPIIDVNRLVKRYRNAETNAVDSISFSVHAGVFFTLWTDEEDDIVIDRADDAARDVALELRRTMFAIINRRATLRRRGRLAPVSPRPAPTPLPPPTSETTAASPSRFPR